MRYAFHPQALAEYEDAARYYANRQPGLELRFMACIESALEEVAQTPTRWNSFEEDVRRYLVRIFPYAILYSIEDDYVQSCTAVGNQATGANEVRAIPNGSGLESLRRPRREPAD